MKTLLKCIVVWPAEQQAPGLMYATDRLSQIDYRQRPCLFHKKTTLMSKQQQSVPPGLLCGWNKSQPEIKPHIQASKN